MNKLQKAVEVKETPKEPEEEENTPDSGDGTGVSGNSSLSMEEYAAKSKERYK